MGKLLCFDVFLNTNFRLTPFRLVFLRLVFFRCLCRCCRCLLVGWRAARTGAGFLRGIPVFRDFPRTSRATWLACLLVCCLAPSFSAVSDQVASMFVSVFPVFFSSVVVSGSSNSVCNKLNLFPHALGASLLVVAPLSGIVYSPFFSVSSFSPILRYSS